MPTDHAICHMQSEVQYANRRAPPAHSITIVLQLPHVLQPHVLQLAHVLQLPQVREGAYVLQHTLMTHASILELA